MTWLANAWRWDAPQDYHTNRFYKALGSEAFIRAVWWEEKRRQRKLMRLPFKKGASNGRKRQVSKAPGKDSRHERGAGQAQRR